MAGLSNSWDRRPRRNEPVQGKQCHNSKWPHGSNKGCHLMDGESTIGEVVKPGVDLGIRNPRAEGGGETEDLS